MIRARVALAGLLAAAAVAGTAQTAAATPASPARTAAPPPARATSQPRAARAAAAQPRCPVRPFGTCFTVTVPLDRSGTVPGVVRLRVARIRARRATRPPLVGLTGGPGQAGVLFAESYSLVVPAAGRDIVMFDQRGTGASGLLRCPSLERRVRSSLAVPAGACARRLGPRRSYYTSADSAADLEAIRVRLGAPRIALYGVSYGTRVALEYARRYPQRVERMILDSPIAPGTPDPLARDTLAAVPRVLRAACRSGCGGAGAHPVADIARLRMRLRRAAIRVPIRGRTIRVDADDLLLMLVSSDLVPDLMERIPAAVRAALAGRPGRLARLKLEAIAVESGGPVSEFSPALFAATTCEETPLAWDPTASPATRRRQARAALAATPARTLYPFDRAAALEAGALPLCGDWPARVRAPAPEPALPSSIPALVLSGDLDLRTPLENARLVARALRAPLVVARNTGHSVLGSDPFGCTATAVERFLLGLRPGRCRSGDASLSIG